MKRRSFLTLAAGAGAAASAARPNLKLGIDTYSLRAFRWNAGQMLDYADANKLDGIQASAGDFENFTEPYLKKLRERSERSRIAIEPGFGCISPLSKGWNAQRQGNPTQYLREAIRVTRALGGRSFRVFTGGAPDRAARTPIPALIESAVQAIRSVRSEAVDAGIRIAVENHGEFHARHVRTIIEEAGRDIAASCLDTGNPVMLAEHPMVALEVLGPYVVTTHIRDSAVWEHPRGAAAQWVALGDGAIDWKAFTARFAELCPAATLQLEIITGRPPTVLPYWEGEFWTGLTDTPAADFAKFAALAKRGSPYMGPMVVADVPGLAGATYRDALRDQQKIDLDRSIEFAKKTLGLGAGK